MNKICVLSVLVAFTLGSGVLAGPWWDDFPRMVRANEPEGVAELNGSFAMNGYAQDPSWGTFFQAVGISGKTAEIAAFQNAGMKQIGYFETYGQTYCLVAELGAWNETNLTPVLHHHWNWQNYSGGTIRWLGAKNFFDDEVYARPYTRTHPRYGGPAMTYPDGSVATGYDGPDTDPRNSRVYDAACSKDVFGELVIDDYYLPPAGSPTNGLVYFPETDSYAGLIYLKKDSACPMWTNYAYAAALQAADAGIDGMWTDNFGAWDSLNSEPVKAAFGEWSVGRFRDHLANSFDSAELTAMGVTNAATFDIRAYLRAKALNLGWDGTSLGSAYWRTASWLDDPLWRAYLIFKRQAGTEALSNYYANVKAAALAGGKPEFLVAGNGIPNFSLGWCRGDLDMVSTELSVGWSLTGGSEGFKPPPVGRFAPLYKLAREHAQSRFVNIWPYNNGYESEFAHPELVKALYYEMLATHTFPKVDLNSGRVVGDAATASNFFGFVEAVAPLYGDRAPVEKVGLYYSSSSVIRQMTPGGFVNFNGQPHQFSFWGWGTALTELHIQYRAVPEWKLTAETLATLDLLILPNADVLDPADVAVLSPWLDAGGKLVMDGECGKYLGESGNFDLNPSGFSTAPLTSHANVTVVAGNIGMDYYLDYENRSAGQRAQFAAALSGLTPQVDTTASYKTGITLYEDETADRFFIDVNNVDIDTNYTVSGTGSIEIEAKLPSWLRGKILRARVVSPGEPVVDLLAASDTNHVKVALSSIDEYAGIIIDEAIHWADPEHSGDWNVANNWTPSLPVVDEVAVWQYAPGNPVITIDTPVEVDGFLAFRSDPSTSYWNANGLQIVNAGTSAGSLSVGSLDLWDGGWFGAQLMIANDDESAAASVLDADQIDVRLFKVDTQYTAGESWFEHEANTLHVQVFVAVGGISSSGHQAHFRQTGGSVTVDHNDYGLRLGQGSTVGTYLLDGGTISVSTVDFINPASVFEFNGGVFSSGARDVIWKNNGRLQLSGLGDHIFDVDAGKTMTLNATVELADKAGERGTLIKSGGGTLALNTAGSISGAIDVRQGTLSLATNSLSQDLYLLVRTNASVSLAFAGTNTVRALSFDEGTTWEAAGTWGALGSGADLESNRFSGTGFLQVGTDQVAPQSWTEAHFTEEKIAAGLAKNDQDPDGDNMSNWQEYTAGTDPMNGASALVVGMAINEGASGVELAFDSVTGRIYSAWFSTNLLNGIWHPFHTNLPGTGFEAVVDDTNDWANVYYRIDATIGE